MPESTKDYLNAMALLDQNMKALKSQHNDPIAWNLNNALAILVRGIQQDMEEMKSRIGDLDKKLSKMK